MMLIAARHDGRGRLTFSDGTRVPNTIYMTPSDGSGGVDTLLAREGLQERLGAHHGFQEFNSRPTQRVGEDYPGR